MPAHSLSASWAARSFWCLLLFLLPLRRPLLQLAWTGTSHHVPGTAFSRRRPQLRVVDRSANAAIGVMDKEQARLLLNSESWVEKAVIVPSPTGPPLELRVCELAGRASDSRDTYGSRLWPASRFIASRLSSNPDAIEGKSVLELGCGNGLGSLAALVLGAKSALATDARRLPLALLWRAAEGIGVRGWHQLTDRLQTAVLDFASPLPSPLVMATRSRASRIPTQEVPLPAHDVLLAADVGYSKALAWRLGERCRESLQAGAQVLIVESRQMPECRLAFSEALNRGNDPGSSALRLEGERWADGDEEAITIWSLDTLTNTPRD